MAVKKTKKKSAKKAKQKATNITWHKADVSRDDRCTLLGHQGAVLWFTGLSGSGKSTLAVEVEKALFQHKCHTFILDGDNVRHGLNKDLGFSPEDRHENIRRIGEVAHLFADAGLIVMTAFISPYIIDRDTVREMKSDQNFVEIYCSCSLDTCEERDTKGLYKKARAGEISEFTGISAPYEAPEHPEITVHTDEETVEKSAARVIAYLEAEGIIS
jgi:adenylylsulfate kinase